MKNPYFKENPYFYMFFYLSTLLDINTENGRFLRELYNLIDDIL